jgi:hypothetical protein
MKDFLDSTYFLVALTMFTGFVIGCIVSYAINLDGINLRVDDKIIVEQKVYRVSDIKVIDTKNIVLNVYKIGESK